MTTKLYHVTFGVQYASLPHPTHPWVHPDGYATLLIDADADPHLAANEIFGDAYAFVYPDDRLKREYHPRGCLMEFDRTTASTGV